MSTEQVIAQEVSDKEVSQLIGEYFGYGIDEEAVWDAYENGATLEEIKYELFRVVDRLQDPSY